MEASLVTLRQHRFEVGVAATAALLCAVIGATIAMRIGTLQVSDACLEAAVMSEDGSGVPSECLAKVRAGAEILGETFLNGQGTLALSVMGVLPFLVGLLGGVPIVASELEGRTAQTAWSLYGSRIRWLRRQVLPVVLVLGLALLVAASVAVSVAEVSVAWGDSQSSLIGTHGPPAVARALGAFGIALSAGAIVGRSLPAFVVAAALSILVLLAVGAARASWTSTLEPRPISNLIDGEAEGLGPRALTTAWGVLAPDGVLLSSAAARELATAAGIPRSPLDEQDSAALQWYEENGYRLVALGISDAQAMDWALYDVGIFASIGVIGTGLAAAAVSRRRLT